MQGGLLAFDLAQITGWGYAKPGSIPAPFSLQLKAGIKAPPHTSGIMKNGLNFSDPIKKLHKFKQNFISKVDEFKPKFIVYEAPILGGKKTNFKTVRFLTGMTVIIDLYCLENGLEEPFDVSVSKARKYFCGKSPRDSEKAKHLVELRCAELSWPYDTQDESDALCILDFGLAWLKRENMLPQAPEEQEPTPNF